LGFRVLFPVGSLRLFCNPVGFPATATWSKDPFHNSGEFTDTGNHESDSRSYSSPAATRRQNPPPCGEGAAPLSPCPPQEGRDQDAVLRAPLIGSVSGCRVCFQCSRPEGPALLFFGRQHARTPNPYGFRVKVSAAASRHKKPGPSIAVPRARTNDFPPPPALHAPVRVKGSSFDLPGVNFVRGALEAFRSKVLATAGSRHSRHRRDPSRTRLCSRQQPQTPCIPALGAYINFVLPKYGK